MKQYDLCFNDILLVPEYSELNSRTVPNISTQLGDITLSIPIISSPMDTITGPEMIITMSNCGGLGILTRYINLPYKEELNRQINEIKFASRQGAKNIGCAIGIKNNVENKSKQLLDAGCNVLCLDVAHGDHKKMYEAIIIVNKLKDKYKFVLMAGNVCTPDGSKRFASYGVDAIKVGIGPGAICTTRVVTGFGRCQLSAIQDIYKAIKHNYPHIAIIADGGIRNSGDMVKCLWCGADACMIGYLLAGTSDAPRMNGKRLYRGMSCRMASGRPDIAPEGIEIKVKYKGKTDTIITDYVKGIRSGLAMGGATNLAELREHVSHVIVSPLSLAETNPKDS